MLDVYDSPLSLQVMSRPRAQFCGALSTSTLRTELEMSVLPLSRARAAGADCAHLQDLLRIMRERLSSPLQAEVPQVILSYATVYIHNIAALNQFFIRSLRLIS